MAELHERLGHGFDERRGTAEERQREILGSLLPQEIDVDPPRVAGPAGGLRPGERVDDVQTVPGELLQLSAIDDVVPVPRRIDEASRHRVAVGRALPNHGHQRHDARASGDEQDGSTRAWIPDEVAADRPAQLEPVAGPRLIGEVRRHFAIVDSLDRQLEVRRIRRGGDRVAPLGLVAVLGGQTHVHVLAGAVAGPVRDVEHDGLDARRLGVNFGDLGYPPGQSPQYRCSFHGSP